MNPVPWSVQLPGQPEQPATNENLVAWAKSGLIKPDTPVKDAASGLVYAAKQIPGIYSTKSWLAAVLLSFFFGGIGVDRFYTGHIGLGLGKLFTLGGFGVWALVDFILFITRQVTDSEGKTLC